MRRRGVGGFDFLIKLGAWRWFGKLVEEEGSRRTPSSVVRVVHAPPLYHGSDGYGVLPSVIVILALPSLMCLSFIVDFVTVVMLCCMYSDLAIFYVDLRR